MQPSDVDSLQLIDSIEISTFLSAVFIDQLALWQITHLKYLAQVWAEDLAQGWAEGPEFEFRGWLYQDLWAVWYESVCVYLQTRLNLGW